MPGLTALLGAPPSLTASAVWTDPVSPPSSGARPPPCGSGQSIPSLGSLPCGRPCDTHCLQLENNGSLSPPVLVPWYDPK